MRLLAISDLHLDYEKNRKAFEVLPPYHDDWIILGGDIGESLEILDFALSLVVQKFKKVIWVPGNHELWTLPDSSTDKDGLLKGLRKYEALIAICKKYGVLTPEDPYPEWTSGAGTWILVPMFLLYDYSFRPAHVLENKAVDWAHEEDVLCADENFLYPDPFLSRQNWCKERCETTLARLEKIPRSFPLILINHFPLRRDLAVTPLFPRFSIWCGTVKTEDWHTRFNVEVVVSGHLHIRSTQWKDNVRFEEVSLGYPRHWRKERGLAHYLRQILPHPKGKYE